uniref:Protein kinase domain-containing protein n=1 Tax=Coccidioides posadasii RMSCC 3488 TaxID=454284 RepID=A0A0J6FP05_COCPO|nr:hypothetical protein CPAG_07015 [Coccidioides posadasii RMSCC 3488]
MIILEHLQYPLRKRLRDLQEANLVTPTEDVLRWACQIAQGLQHAHARGVLQVDIGPHNILLDGHGNVKLADFAGSSIDGSSPSIASSTRAEHPRFPSSMPSLQTEVFALGSAFYELETTRKPFHDKMDHEVEKLFGAGNFPDTSSLELGRVISACWMMEYQDVGDVLRDIELIQKEKVRTEIRRG